MSHSLETYQRIVIEGPIGVGKTSLATKLAMHLHRETLLETPQCNVFLERFYREPARYALATQLTFLMQRMQQMQMWQQAVQREQAMISDFLLAKDRLFATLTLPADELALYNTITTQMTLPAQSVDLVIALQSTPADLIARIAKRGIDVESAINTDYLQRLCDAYGELYLRYDDASMLIVDTTHFNPVEHDDDFRTLLARIDAMRGRKEFLNLATPSCNTKT